MSRIFLCGLTSKEHDNMKALTDPIHEFVDGLIYVVDDGAFKDGTYELLEERKGGGEILRQKWINQNDWSMNLWLHGSVLKPGDIFVFRDSLERFNPDFAKQLPDYLRSMSFNGVKTWFNYGKIFAAVYNDNLFFVGSPHFGLHGAQQKSIDLKSFHDETKHEWTWRVSDGEQGGRPIDNKIDHEAKYLWNYGRSNHLLLGNEDNYDQFLYLDAIRLHVRDTARLHGFEMTLDGFQQFLEWGTSEERDDQTRQNIKNFINGSYVYKNFYRKRILGHRWEDIEATEQTWKLEY